MIKKYLCPVCGYDKLLEQPYSRYPDPNYSAFSAKGSGNGEICPCCTFQFGVTDADRGITLTEWRNKWIASGMIWDEGASNEPAGWNPKDQLKNIGIDIEKPGWENLEPFFSSEGRFLGLRVSKQG